MTLKKQLPSAATFTISRCFPLAQDEGSLVLTIPFAFPEWNPEQLDSPSLNTNHLVTVLHHPQCQSTRFQ